MSEVLRFSDARVEELRAFLLQHGFALGSRPHAWLHAARPGVDVTVYRSGKLVVQGAQASEFAGVLAGMGLADAIPDERPALEAFAPHAGSDESGKGDYFGPLCVAAVHVPDAATAKLLVDKGVRDSKRIGDAAIGPLASLVRLRCPSAAVVLAPPRYNDVYEASPGLNGLLAWAHAAALEKLLAQVGPVPVVVDQFARPEVLRSKLKELGRATSVSQRVGGEADVAVAAASVLARADFLAGIAALGAQHGLRLPLGAGPPVTRAAREIAAKGGRPLLREVAKLHFRTTEAALGA